jgi:hypothetical protein
MLFHLCYKFGPLKLPLLTCCPFPSVMQQYQYCFLWHQFTFTSPKMLLTMFYMSLKYIYSIYVITCFNRSRDRAVGIATGYGLDDQGISLFTTASRPALRSTPSSIQWVLEVKHQGRKANLSAPLSAEVKIERSYISTPPHAFMLL